VDFKNTLIIMTSNLGSHALAEASDAGMERAREEVLEACRRHFRPEFLNRIDEIVVFNRLGEKEIAKIVDIQVRRTADLLASRGIKLEISDRARALLAKAGFDPVYGARPLKRTIQKRLADPLAAAILRGDFKEGETVHVDADGDELTFGGKKKRS
jgi:ATP-dependent Clp protease ATP-binding subunit ClpB